jgi:DNA primase small subunit
LFNYLKTDIGIPQDSFTTYFSGNNGFHVYIENVQFEALDSFARSDLAGYLMGIGIIPESFGLRKNPTGKHGIRFRKTNFSYGWRRRIADKINIDSPPKIEKLVEKMGGYSGFKTFLQETAMSLGVKLDPQVTSDVHRIFRLSGSLNSKSGLAKIQVTNLDSFDPFSDACLLSKDPITVSIKCPVVLSLKGKTFKLSRETTTLPTYAAIYLMCKGIATAAS